jgi:hypothetical protein
LAILGTSFGNKLLIARKNGAVLFDKESDLDGLSADELEAAKKLEDARREMKEKNLQEDGRATAQNLQIYKNKEIVIATETAEKIKQIRSKYAIAQFNEEEAAAQEFNAAWAAENNRRAALVVSSQQQTRELEYQRESLDLKYQMI